MGCRSTGSPKTDLRFAQRQSSIDQTRRTGLLSRAKPARKFKSRGNASKVNLVDFQQDASSSRRSLDDSSNSNVERIPDTLDTSEELVFEPESSTSNREPKVDSSESDFGMPVQFGSVSSASSLSLEQVLTSVAVCYPEIEIAIGAMETANGNVLASWGEFDQVFSAHSISQPLGFYQTYRNGVGLSRPLYSGGEVYGTYRIGDGNFEPWFGERETNEGGELKAGFSMPLLKDRAIDERRAKLLASGFQRDQVEASVNSRLLQFQRFATQAYWDWVASGQAVQVQQQILQLAEKRVDQIAERINDGDLAQIAQIDNDRFIAKRKNDLIKAKRSLEKAAIKLSLFWRNQDCAPVVVSESQLPADFPTSIAVGDGELSADIETALGVRPELQELIALRKEVCTNLRYAQNLTLPKIDLKGFAGQDLGGETSSKGDKTPFELQIGVLAEVPIQRREGLGKIQAAEGKLNQIDAKTRMVSDKIRAEIQDAASAVNAAHEQIEQSTENLRLTRRSLELGRLSFREGDIDLIALNIYETSVADAELQLLDAQFKYFFYRAVYETAIQQSAF